MAEFKNWLKLRLVDLHYLLAHCVFRGRIFPVPRIHFSRLFAKFWRECWQGCPNTYPSYIEHAWKHRFGVLLSNGDLQRTLMYQASVRTNILKAAGNSWEHMEQYKKWQNEIDKLNEQAVQSGLPHVKAFQTCSVYPLMATEIVAVNGIVVAVSISASFAILSIYMFIGSVRVCVSCSFMNMLTHLILCCRWQSLL